jgi:hypothetical protein
MKNKKKWFLIVLNIIFILSVLFLFYNILNNNEYLIKSTETISELGNDFTVIEIKSTYNWKMTYLYILIILFDIVILTTFKIINYNKKHIKEIYVLLIICIINLLFILLFPSTFISLIIINISLIVIFIIKMILSKKSKTMVTAHNKR